jgi:hypothetical protein
MGALWLGALRASSATRVGEGAWPHAQAEVQASDEHGRNATVDRLQAAPAGDEPIRFFSA